MALAKWATKFSKPTTPLNEIVVEITEGKYAALEDLFINYPHFKYLHTCRRYVGLLIFYSDRYKNGTSEIDSVTITCTKIAYKAVKYLYKKNKKDIYKKMAQRKNWELKIVDDPEIIRNINKPNEE